MTLLESAGNVDSVAIHVIDFYHAVKATITVVRAVSMMSVPNVLKRQVLYQNPKTAPNPNCGTL